MTHHSIDILNQAPWFRLHSVDSTNNFLMKYPEKDLVNGMTCTADIQTEGQGRQNRAWVSPQGGLYMSILLLPELDQRFWHLVSFVMGVAASESIAILYPDIKPRLKWPNDILINQFKVAGILVQSKSYPSPRLVVGIGINVSTNPQALPNRPLFPAATLNRLSRFDIPIHELAAMIRSKFLFDIVNWFENPNHILKQWELFSATQDSMVTIKIDKTEYTGQYCGLLDDGGLQLLIDNRIEVFYSGDILAIISE